LVGNAIKPTTRQRYAIRALVEIALRSNEGPVLLKDIAKAQNISMKYLEQIVRPLRQKGCLIAERGPKGGYRLAVQADKITILNVLECIGGQLTLLECLRDKDICNQAAECVTRVLWGKVNHSLRQVLSKVTLEDLCKEQAKMRKPKRASQKVKGKSTRKKANHKK